MKNLSKLKINGLGRLSNVKELLRPKKFPAVHFCLEKEDLLGKIKTSITISGVAGPDLGQAKELEIQDGRKRKKKSHSESRTLC